jgi:hypothetical protein
VDQKLLYRGVFQIPCGNRKNYYEERLLSKKILCLDISDDGLKK